MTGAPSTRYARSGDVNIPYQVVGDGPRDRADQTHRRRPPLATLIVAYLG